MDIVQVVNPSITLADIKEHLRVDFSQDDGYLTALLESAIQEASTYINVYPYGIIYESTPDELDPITGVYELDIPYAPYGVEYTYGAEVYTFPYRMVQEMYSFGEHSLYVPVLAEEADRIIAAVLLQKDRVPIFNQAVKLMVEFSYANRGTTDAGENPGHKVLDLIMQKA